MTLGLFFGMERRSIEIHHPLIDPFQNLTGEQLN